MITVAEIVLSARTKLGDTDIEKYRYSDVEIIDAINDALAVMSEDLLCFSRTWVVECKKCVNRYLLPADFLRPISLLFNKKLITNIESMESRINNKTTRSGVAYDNQTIHLFLGEIKASDEIEFYYNYFETVSNIEEAINLPNNAKEIIVYYVLHLLYQNPIKKDGLKRSEYYLAMYERKKIPFRSRLRKNTQSKHIRSGFKKV
jgi:hypothetical protein